VAEPLINSSVYPKKLIKERKIVEKGKQKQEKIQCRGKGEEVQEKERICLQKACKGSVLHVSRPIEGGMLIKGRPRQAPPKMREIALWPSTNM